MRCPSCEHDNRTQRRIRAECGAALAEWCTAGEASNELGEKCYRALYACFSEGCATRDLQDAYALLEEPGR